MMYKIIDFLFSWFVKMRIYDHTLYKKELKLSQLYFPIFITLYAYILITLGACAFVLVDSGIIFDKVESLYIAMIIAIVLSGAFVYQAKRKHFVENKLATIEPKSDEEMNKYITHVSSIKLILFSSYPLMLMLICYLLSTYVFNG